MLFDHSKVGVCVGGEGEVVGGRERCDCSNSRNVITEIIEKEIKDIFQTVRVA